MNIKEYIKNHILYLDGGTGTLLQEAGLAAGEATELWSISHPDTLVKIHRDYFNAGSNVVSANTFGANSLKYSDTELEAIIKASMENVIRAKAESSAPQPKWVALDLGPTGRMLKPYGDLDFEDAVEIFAKTVRLGVRYGAELISIQTMNDSYETKAALLAAKENSDLPIFVENAYGEDGKLMTGAEPLSMIAMLEGMGADAIGINCSLGPQALFGVARDYLKYSSLPVIFKPNAGLPEIKDGRAVYDISSDRFASDIAALVKEGVGIVGGCCGTTPEYISALVEATRGISAPIVKDKGITAVSSYTHAVTFGSSPILIGERINPTGKKRIKEALRAGDMGYILNEGIAQGDAGCHILDVNVGLPEIDEPFMLKRTVCELQAIINLPLQIDTSDTAAMEAALRVYNGKAMINSVNGKRESMGAVFPIAKKYGGLIVALTLDEGGIPDTAEGRLEIAKKILSVASEYGISKKDIIFDPLALTVSADDNAGRETLRAVELISKELGCHTSLGVSNVSFGLPMRDIINSSFFTLAMGKGLSAAIMNPHSVGMMNAYHSFLAIDGKDSGCREYINYAGTLVENSTVISNDRKPELSGDSELKNAIIKGLKDRAREITCTMLASVNPLDIVQNEIIPALNTVGVGFEEKRIYLPQLLMSAESAKAAFEEIKARMPKEKSKSGCAFVIATVKGDIHDIGKNIVKLLLENYGFEVYDLGRDVAPEAVAQAVSDLKAPLLGLSALMTTTVPAMEETVNLVRKTSPECKIVVGGAVLTREYAEKMGADKYAKDAMETVRYAEEINKIIVK